MLKYRAYVFNEDIIECDTLKVIYKSIISAIAYDMVDSKLDYCSNPIIYNKTGNIVCKICGIRKQDFLSITVNGKEVRRLKPLH